MKILLIGASSYIGQNLKARLETISDFELISTSRNSGEGHKYVDLSEAGWSTKLFIDDVDIVIYLAQSRFYRDFPEQVNDIINININSVIEAADWGRRNHIKRFIFLSTGNVYGNSNEKNKETDVCIPQSIYGASKLSAEILLKQYSGFFEICILRLFGTYGPHQVDNLIPNIINKFHLSEPITLASNIGIKFNPLYIDDLVKIIIEFFKLGLKSQYEIFNVGSKNTIDLRMVVEQLKNISGEEADVNITDQEPASLIGDVAKLNKCVDLIEKTSLTEGLSNTYYSIMKLASSGSEENRNK